MTPNTDNEVQTSATPSESTKTPKSMMPKPLQPRVCVQRDENTLVPLIAIDELPDSVVLKGVPLKLTLIEALKAHMELINVDYPAQGARYQLDRPISTHVDLIEQSDDSASDGSPTSEGSLDSIKKEFKRSDKKGNKNVKDKASKHPLLTPNDNSIIDPLAKKGTMGKKVYCTYWIQTGNCNYMQEGCKYKHEIPKDEETRRAIGFREFPNWPREEMPARPPPAINRSWRRQDGKSQDVKPELHRAAGASGPSNRGAQSSAAAQGVPNTMARANSQPSAGASKQAAAAAANAQYYPNVVAFSSPHQHSSTHANHTTQQCPFSQGAQSVLGGGAGENHHQRLSQNNASPPSYGLHLKIMNGGRSGSSTPPKQPPISRPTNVANSSVGQQQHSTSTSSRRAAPDQQVLSRASGLSGSGVPDLNINPAHIKPRPVYSGMHNNWNPHTNAPTSMDISFIAPSPNSTPSGSQPIYTPNFTSSDASATPTFNNSLAFGSLNDTAKPHLGADTPAAQHHHHNKNAAANNGNAPAVKGRGPIQYGLTSPSLSTGSAQNNLQQASTTADESDATSVTSPPVQHRVFFREPGQPEFVTNGPEPKKHNGRTSHGLKKHGRKAHGENGVKSAKSKMSGNGYDVPNDGNEQL